MRKAIVLVVLCTACQHSATAPPQPGMERAGPGAVIVSTVENMGGGNPDGVHLAPVAPIGTLPVKR